LPDCNRSFQTGTPGRGKSDFYILPVAAWFTIWNVSIGFTTGLAMREMVGRKMIKSETVNFTGCS
jgi:hypothetical protein